MKMIGIYRPGATHSAFVGSIGMVECIYIESVFGLLLLYIPLLHGKVLYVVAGLGLCSGHTARQAHNDSHPPPWTKRREFREIGHRRIA